MFKTIQKLIHKIKDFLGFLFPSRCFGCGLENQLLCSKCLSELPLPIKGKTRYIDLFIAASGYQSPVLRASIREMKFRSSKNMADILGEFLASSVREIVPFLEKENTVVIPIPLSKKRMRSRGYKQAERIAGKISEYHALNLAPSALIKIKNTLPQTKFKNKNDRIKNTRGVFAINREFSPSGKTILLVDDVMTSGATLNEAARILKKSGAKHIFAAVVAKG